MSRFKTELCNNLIELGSCKYGDRCHYAHGAHELRQVSRRHPKYRTETCKNFELTGKCPFGPRCSYVHPKPDLDSMIEQLTKYMKYTKAPKPDSEDDQDELSLFTRTNTSTSLSTFDSMVTLNEDENKENQLVGCRDDYFNASSTLSNLDRRHFINDHSFAHYTNLNAIKRQNSLKASKANLSPSTSVLPPPPSTATPFSPTIHRSNHGGSRVATTIAPSIARTPLAQSNSTNILTPVNILNLNQDQRQSHLTNQNLIRASDQIIGRRNICNTPTTINTTGRNGTCNDDNLSFFEATSYGNNKKPRLISTDSSNSNNAASNPFGISNPLSDYLNNTNINRRSSLHPNKQFYTRF